MKILLLDGNSLTYRAFYALPTDMATASGQVTNAVFGFTSMFIYMVKDQQPDAVVVAFDRPEKTFRHEADPLYKAQREAAPDILRQQMGLVREVLAALNITVLDLAGWEADDILATLAEQAKQQGHDAIIVTGDRDSYQLVDDPHVRVMYNKRGVSDYALYDEAGIANKTGVTPLLYPQYAALRGDPSDNLEGVPGVGEKTAAKLLNQYGSLDGIFAHVSEQTPKLQASLIEHEGRARHNFEMMTLRRDAPVSVAFETLTVEPNDAEVKRLFDFLEFRALHDRLYEALSTFGIGAAAGAVPLAPSGDVLEAEVTDVATAADAAALIAAQTTLDLVPAWVGDPGRSAVIGLAVVTDPDGAEVAWLPSEVVQAPEVLKALGSHAGWRGHNAKALMRWLLDQGGAVPGLRLDTAIAAYLIDPADTRYAVRDLLARYTRFQLPDDGAASSGQLDFGGGPDERQIAARGALAVAHLSTALEASLDKQGMADLYASIENPLVGVLAKMEHVGIAVDVAELTQLNERLTADVERLGAVLQEVVGRPFNINSPIQLREILYTERGLAPGKKTKTGFSTDAATLEKLRDEWPEFIDPLLRYREVEKLRGTYGTGLLAEVAPDGRIHATFNQTVARTGRLSSDQPNLHNIPVRSEEGKLFRKAFIPAPRCQLLVADYNQIELRCIAHLAQDPGLIEAFTSGTDIHNATASRVFGVEPTEVTTEQRSKAKMVSYGLAYGMEAYGLAQRLAIPTSEAAVILDAYFEAFPNVKDYMDRTVVEARMRGYTETLFGRRRPIPELSNSNFRIRQAGERQAMNAGIQGLAADIFKVALVRIDEALDAAGVASQLVLQVHDEVLVETPEAEMDEVGPLVIDLMRGAAQLDVPLEVNVAWGQTWAAGKS
ncbi:MAG TPA: DNA polymerase I [Ilumatobacteraceae bacterium]|nr:DNA polymerase I [Ilumatobacteraceae bacterium]